MAVGMAVRAGTSVTVIPQTNVRPGSPPAARGLSDHCQGPGAQGMVTFTLEELLARFPSPTTPPWLTFALFWKVPVPVTLNDR